MTLIAGCDISNWDGELTPDWAAAVRAAGVGHVVVRASLESPEKQAITRQQLSVLTAAGLSVSVYVWVYPAPWEPRATVRDAIALVAGFPAEWIWLDVEDTQSWAGLAPAVLLQWLTDALDEIAHSGKHGGIYTAAWCWQPMTGNSTALAGVPLWVAAYDGVPDLAAWPRFGGWTDALGKQYQGNGKAPPLAGRAVDLDVFDPAILPAPAPQPAPDPAFAAMIDQLAYCIQCLADPTMTRHDALGQTHDRAAAVAAQAAGLLAGGSA